MTGAAISVSEQREKMMDFSVPFMYYTQDLIMKKPSSGIKAVDLLQFMTPFENLVWFCTLATLVITSVAVFVLNYYSPYGYKNENGEGTSDEFSFFNSVWFALACMLQQGGDNTPRSFSGRKKNASTSQRLNPFLEANIAGFQCHSIQNGSKSKPCNR